MALPTYRVVGAIKGADGKSVSTLPSGSTTLYIDAAPAPAAGAPAPGDATASPLVSSGSNRVSENAFQVEFERVPFAARPAFALTKGADATTPVEVVLNVNTAHFDKLHGLELKLLAQAGLALEKLTTLPLEPKNTVKPATVLTDGRLASASLPVRIKGFSAYMTPGEPRVVSGVSYPGDPTWSAIKSSIVLPAGSTVFWLAGPGGAFARTARPHRHAGPQDIRPNTDAGKAFVYPSHIWVRTLKGDAGEKVQFGVTFALSSIYLTPRKDMPAPAAVANPLGVAVYDPDAEEGEVGAPTAASAAAPSDAPSNMIISDEGSPRKRTRFSATTTEAAAQ